MHPAPIKVTEAPSNALYVNTLSSGEEIYRVPLTGVIYAVQPKTINTQKETV